MKLVMYLLVGVFLLISQSVFAATQSSAISEKTIIDATWSLYVWQVLGVGYNDPTWTSGTYEDAEVGQKGQTDRKNNARAICLGRERDFYVFFTLRSFVDAAFPNLFIQGVKGIPHGEDGKPFVGNATNSQDLVRYGTVTLTAYKDQGGGDQKLTAKISAITHCDNNNPRCLGPSKIQRLYSDYSETIDNVKYDRPHEQVSAKKHLEFQKTPKVSIRFIDEHDIALVYVPVSLFKGEAIRTLGINNPTLSVKLALEHNKELFGFKFILIGQETLDKVKSYTAEKSDLAGFQKLVMIAGLALDIDTLTMLKSVDETLDQLIPDKLANAKNRSELAKIGWEEYNKMAVQIVSDPVVLANIKSVLIPAIYQIGTK